MSPDPKQIKLLNTPLGIPGSGYTRYAAAMGLFQNGHMTSEILEAYRICCKLDNEDPLAAFKKRQRQAEKQEARRGFSSLRGRTKFGV